MILVMKKNQMIYTNTSKCRARLIRKFDGKEISINMNDVRFRSFTFKSQIFFSERICFVIYEDTDDGLYLCRCVACTKGHYKNGLCKECYEEAQHYIQNYIVVKNGTAGIVSEIFKKVGI